MVELAHVDGIALALGAAILVAVQSLLVRKGTDTGRATDAVLVVMSVNFLILLPVVIVAYYPDFGLTRRSWLSFIAAGLFGTMLGRACMYTSIDRIGASRTMPIVAANAFVATVLGVLLLGESLVPVHGVGIVLVIAGVAAIAWETSHENPDGLDRRSLLLGLALPFGAAIAYGWEPVFARYGLDDGTPPAVGLVIKTAAAIIGFLLYLRWRNAIPSPEVFRTTGVKWYLMAGVCNTFFLLGYYVALSLAPVNVIVPIIITNTLFVVIFSAIFMPQRLERVTAKLAGAAVVVVIGVVLISVYG